MKKKMTASILGTGTTELFLRLTPLFYTGNTILGLVYYCTPPSFGILEAVIVRLVNVWHIRFRNDGYAYMSKYRHY